GHRPRDLERHLGGVDLVVGTVGQPDLDVDHGVAGEHAGIERLAHALLHGRDVLTRDGAPHELVFEDDTAARLVGLDLEVDVAVLTAAARLPYEPALGLGGPADRLPVGDLRLADVGLDPELAQESVDD